ncbi:hypothetical protein BGZ65_006772 [Modicella reniformis]|uniref:F-box domain-containing protein n=1 Tax=Modicella reniformis TaxID=1440133 RepID=A0A9P6JH42_9FUNG|nr:hypothetical protein BGZ65_006772 [Modicella reniformis]
MFDITELNDMVYGQLSRRDLARCAPVNKQWHKTVIPYLWRDITNIWGWNQRQVFYRMVLEDYLQEQNTNPLLPPPPPESSSSSLSGSLSTLTKYGRWIRVIPSHSYLLGYFWNQKGYSETGPTKQPTTYDLLGRFLEQCPFATVQHDDLDLFGWERVRVNRFKFLAEIYFPRVQSLSIKIDPTTSHWMLKYLLNRCSTNLETLTLEALEVKVTEVDEGEGRKDLRGDYYEDEEGSDEVEWQLKRLKLKKCFDYTDPNGFWSWLWRRCNRLKALEVCETGDIICNLTEGMLTHMPDLTEIHLGWGTFENRWFSEKEIVSLLSGSRKGWKVVRLKASVKMRGPLSKRALAAHFPTLEKLEINGRNGWNPEDLIAILSSCFKLQSLVVVNGDPPLSLPATTFTDRDPDTGGLKAWACEESLEVLQINIKDIPRPGSGDGKVSTTRGILEQVHDRLVRLTKLKSLKLSYDSLED